MIVVYWLEHRADPAEGAEPRHAAFAQDALREALQFAEQLRARRAAGEPISHVSLQSELPQSVGPAGVADPAADYAHYKRRPDPSIPLGRPSGTRRED
jgi:hypothetical protein